MERKTYGYWTKEKVLEESKKYKSIGEFREHSVSAYSSAKRHKWIDDMPYLERKKRKNGYWHIKENVINASKECFNISQFEKKYSAGYQSALARGWLSEMTWLYKRDTIKFVKLYSIYVYLDNVNKVAYVGLTNDKEQRHQTHLTGIYHYKKSQSEVFKYFSKMNMSIPNPIYLEDNLTPQQAREREQYWKSYYENELGYTMLNIAKCGSLGGGVKKWTKEAVFKVAKNFSTRTTFAKGQHSAYCIALNNKWLDEMTWLISKQKPYRYWNYETCKEESKKYKSRIEFEKSNGSAYGVACKHKWLDEFFPKSIINKVV